MRANITSNTSVGYTNAITLQGLTGLEVEVETHVANGLVGITMVGLPDASIKEARERVRAALNSCALPPINRRITVNLSPATIPKAGGTFDLAIAVSLLMARGFITRQIATSTIFAAELGLDASLKPARGILAIALEAKRLGYERIVVAPQCAAEARLSEIEVIPCVHLEQLLKIFSQDVDNLHKAWDKVAEKTRETYTLDEQKFSTSPTIKTEPDLDLSEVRGQSLGVKALLAAAAGGHHLMLYGEAGCGKTMLAQRLSTILPDLDHDTAMTLAMIKSLKGTVISSDQLLDRSVPSEFLHPSITLAALIGGGVPPNPGAASLAHGGVLILDEAPQFSLRCLDGIRQAMDFGYVTLHRSSFEVTLPSLFQMVLTANPCPCGVGADQDLKAGLRHQSKCNCTKTRKLQYRQKLTGPFLDRVDIQLELGQPKDLNEKTLTSLEAQELVVQARQRAKNRWEGLTGHRILNSRIPGKYLRKYRYSSKHFQMLEMAVKRRALSMRSFDKVLRIAWSLADLRDHNLPDGKDLEEAFKFREKLYNS